MAKVTLVKDPICGMMVDPLNVEGPGLAINTA
jgi:hypothetical protein